MSNTILLNNRPEGKPQESDFKFVEQEVGTPGEQELLVEALYVSVDPYLRGRMRDEKSYVPPFELNEPISSNIVAKVLESKHENFKEGDYVSGNMAWKKKQVVSTDNLQKVNPDQAPLSAYLGILGLTGLTAYLGLNEIGQPQKGETLLVSGAAGAVGSVVGQIGKILGLKVVGIAGSDEKIEMLTSKFGFDGGINYKTTENMKEAIGKACPDGVDIYFDNVGGEISDAVLFHINKMARIVICGAIAVYNKTETPKALAVQPFLVKNSALMQGFIVSNYADKFKEAAQQLAQWLQEDQLHYEETIVEGFENIPQAFIDLFDGKNKGKMVVKA
ncbi:MULTISPECIES: NADP-dependent oxidoreductase [Mesonia]|uniref:NADP-dependent oxidoreductase YfmJ n=1 Tax=Mesonia oceanica TaxID=2687242 RepID=A0AC61YCX4_9FLAO|nr:MULTISPECIES: NADP-dependent oxidoreductase [Mesonia]MAN26496.1 NADP-dependent oxidoreductase [Mesonia sp.]MAQ39591.1 NADP-dependent oxidoreductase [Mesonia sp.]MBJ97847.1 NADP-dependent oxidoreductase [Flavobacteriaceae bacterium]VVV02354.1 Putative NADP-dependent oxidoreductase YfmJ [Mesonia oceanica]|tara:strand:- start:8050 stop:9045 length:996 start_codon:yes stop_codon:yes gene_type:complete